MQRKSRRSRRLAAKCPSLQASTAQQRACIHATNRRQPPYPLRVPPIRQLRPKASTSPPNTTRSDRTPQSRRKHLSLPCVRQKSRHTLFQSSDFTWIIFAAAEDLRIACPRKSCGPPQRTPLPRQQALQSTSRPAPSSAPNRKATGSEDENRLQDWQASVR